MVTAPVIFIGRRGVVGMTKGTGSKVYQLKAHFLSPYRDAVIIPFIRWQKEGSIFFPDPKTTHHTVISLQVFGELCFCYQ